MMSEINLKLKSELALTFNYFRSQVSNDRKKPATNIDVMIALFQAMKVKRVMESKIASLNANIAKLNTDIMELLRDSINRPINIQVGALAQATAQIPVAPPKPAPQLSDTADPYIKELDAKFRAENYVNGQLKPSLMMAQEWEVDEE